MSDKKILTIEDLVFECAPGHEATETMFLSFMKFRNGEWISLKRWGGGSRLDCVGSIHTGYYAIDTSLRNQEKLREDKLAKAYLLADEVNEVMIKLQMRVL
jgi:hypothetical protein